MRGITVPVFIAHQGCPHTCVFCDQHQISGSRGQLPDAAGLLTQIDAWSHHAGGRPLDVAFFGGSFTALPVTTQDRLLAPLQPLLADGRLRQVRISTRPDHIDSVTLHRLAGQGVRIVELGVQSLDDVVLERSGREHSAETAETALRCIKASGLVAGAQLMPGLPGDTVAASLDSLQRVIDCGADFVRIYPTVVLEGTELARRHAAGDYEALDLESGIHICKRMLHLALRRSIPVIRIGLQAGDGIRESAIMAGCWHPALGQLVRSRLYFDLVDQYLSAAAVPPGHLAISCHPERHSDLVGNRRSHLDRWRTRGIGVTVRSDASLERDAILLNHCTKHSIITDLKYD